MTDTATRPGRWAQFRDRDLVEPFCRKAGGLPPHHLGTPRAGLIVMVERAR